MRGGEVQSSKWGSRALECALLAGTWSCGQVEPAAVEPGIVEPGVVATEASLRAAPPLSGASPAVMIQAFDWASAGRGGWYGTIRAHAAELGAAGFAMAWLPPPTGASSPQGYLPRELNVLDSAYGSRADLVAAIDALHAADLAAIADVVVNHRVGSTGWCDLRNPDWGSDAITSDDEGFSDARSDCRGRQPTGAGDSGEPYAAARDLDHTKATVRDGIVTWMNDRLKGVGFDGWRFDYVKGFAGGYVEEYSSRTSAYFCVGEEWPTRAFDPNDPEPWRSEITRWVDSTHGHCAAFDYVTKGLLNTVLATGEYGRLRRSDGRPAGLMGTWPSRAVTFVDNHDTGPSGACGSGQNHWPVPCDRVMLAYAYILTHPGVPSVYWPHYYDWNLKGPIDALMAIRRTQSIDSESPVVIERAEQDLYAATIAGRVAVRLGARSWAPSGAGWTRATGGTDWEVWTHATLPTTPCTLPSLSLRGTFNAWGNLAMSCASTGTWSASGVTFGSTATERFKLDVYGDWRTNYGDNGGDGIADLGGADIPVRTGAGAYTITYEEATRRYTVRLDSATPPPPPPLPPPSTTARIRFVCQNGVTAWGQNLYVVGSVVALGSWDPARAVQLAPTAYPEWSGEVTVPAGTCLEWKCLRRDPVTWQGGANNTVCAPASGTVTATARF